MNFNYLIEIIFSSNSQSINKYCNTMSKFTNSNYTRLECTNINVNDSSKYLLDNANKNILEYYKQKGNEDGINFLSENNKDYKNLKRFFNEKKTYITINPIRF